MKQDLCIFFFIIGGVECTLVKPEAGNTLAITVYRKRTHIDNLVAKDIVIRTLTHRTRTVCTKPELLSKELKHLRKALTKCKYPKWALDKVERKFTNRTQETVMWNLEKKTVTAPVVTL